MAGAESIKGSMEREVGRQGFEEFPSRKAPYASNSRRRNCVVLRNGGEGKNIPQFNGKQLKISVVKLNGRDIGKPSVVSLLGKTDNTKAVEQKDAKNKYGSKRSNLKERISNNNTIKDRSGSSLTTVTEHLIENSLSKLCSDCGSCADSPQSIVSEDNSSQASDSLFVKGENAPQCPSSSTDTPESSQKTEEAQSSSNPCKWANCSNSQVDLGQLQEHIISTHIQSQTTNGSFVCMWTGCKVYNKPSLSRSWIERHILHHSGGKPFRCIIDGCRLMFSSRFLQERHVRSHFETYQNQGSKNGKEGSAGSPSKISRKRKLKKKVVRPIKTEDSFDAYVMEKIKAQLLYKDSTPSADINGSTATFRSTVIAKRLEPNGTTSVLLHWNPPNIKPDEWVSADQVRASVCIPLSSLPQMSHSLYTAHRFRKHRRK